MGGRRVDSGRANVLEIDNQTERGKKKKKEADGDRFQQTSKKNRKVFNTPLRLLAFHVRSTRRLRDLRWLSS
jgi:hypothetical protein